jgi:hypothetical protein
MVSKGAFPAYCVCHRGNVVDEVIEAALKVSEQFETLAIQVERMERRRVMKDEQLRFAERALALRYPDPMLAGMQPSQLLNCRRVEDIGDDLWTVLNRVQLCRAQHNCTYVAMLVMWRTLLQHGQIRFPRTSPSHNLGQRERLIGAGRFTHYSWQRSAKCSTAVRGLRPLQGNPSQDGD